MTDTELLERLVNDNFYCDSNKELSWCWRESVTLHRRDPELNAALLKRFPEKVK